MSLPQPYHAVDQGRQQGRNFVNLDAVDPCTRPPSLRVSLEVRVQLVMVCLDTDVDRARAIFDDQDDS